MIPDALFFVILMSDSQKMPEKLRRFPPLLTAMFGAGLAGAIAVPAIMLGVGLANEYLANRYLFSEEDIVRLAWLGVVGAQGGAMSLIMRLRSLVDDDHPPMLHFLNGLIKPFVGMTFGHLSYMAFSSGIVAMPDLGEREIYFFAVVAFAAGFSERFAKDLMLKVGEKTQGDDG